MYVSKRLFLSTTIPSLSAQSRKMSLKTIAVLNEAGLKDGQM
jgi:hypothetical protein